MKNKHEYSSGPPDEIDDPLLMGAVNRLIEHKWGEDYLPNHNPYDVDYDDEPAASWWNENGGIQSSGELMIPDDYNEFEAEVESGFKHTHELIDMLTKDVFNPCQEKVGAAVGESLGKAHGILADAARDALHENPRNPRIDDRYQAFQNFQLLIKAAATQLGVTDFQTSVERYATHPRHAVAAEQLRFHGQRNTYTVDFDGYYGALEMHGSSDSQDESYDEIYDHEYHRVQLVVEAIPTRRFNMSITHSYDSSAEWVRQDVIDKNGRHVQTDFSIRFDKDPHSRSGYSLDVGRSMHDSGEMQRPGDVVGRVLQVVRSEGSHFTDGFEGVTEYDFETFIANMKTLLQVDAEMGRLDVELAKRERFNHDRAA